MGSQIIKGVNPTLGSLNPDDLAALQQRANPYYQYLQNPDTFDYNTLPTGTTFALAGGGAKYSGYNIDYDSLRTTLKAAADAKAAQQAATDKANADALATAAATAAKHTSDVTTAGTQAQSAADDIVRQWGLDPSSYDSRIAGQIANKTAALGSTDNPYNALDGSAIATALLNGDQTAQRNSLTQQANQKFGANYGNNLISSHLLDDAVASTLGTQRTAAQDYLDRGKARGIYNDTGYNAGETALGTQSAAASSKVQSLADGVLDSYRTKANTIRDNAYSAAGSSTLGSPINLDDYVGQGNDVLSQATSRGAGDLASAIGGTQYYDFSGLNNAAGQAQGTGNFVDSDLVGALAERNKQKMAARGLGSQGVF